MKFKECLCFQLSRAVKKMTKYYRDRITEFGLTHTQFFLLTALYEEDGILVSELAKKIGVDKATMTGLIDRLEQDGLIKREKDHNDRRVYKIFLTKKSEELREKLTKIYHEVNMLFLSSLSNQEKETLNNIINKIENIK